MGQACDGMSLSMRRYQGEQDYTAIREFLRDTFLLNGRGEINWHVGRLDYWRWHCIQNCRDSPPVEEVTFIWETSNGDIAAVLNPEHIGEAWFQVHPDHRTRELEGEMLDVAEQHLAKVDDSGRRILKAIALENDDLRSGLLKERGYETCEGSEVHLRRDLATPLPIVNIPDTFTIRSLGGDDELPARSWASWRGFHPDEPDDDYEGWEWYRNIQRMPLYRKELDIVAVTEDGTIASMTTVWYDEPTRSGYFEPVATVPEYRRKGLASAVILEGMRRLRELGADLALVGTGAGMAAEELYLSIRFEEYLRTVPWCKDIG